jgi:hypothetical protein
VESAFPSSGVRPATTQRSTSAAPQPLLDEPTNLHVLSERQRTPVALLRFVVVAPEPTKHVGASEVEGRVLHQSAGALDALEPC